MRASFLYVTSWDAVGLVTEDWELGCSSFIVYPFVNYLLVMWG